MPLSWFRRGFAPRKSSFSSQTPILLHNRNLPPFRLKQHYSTQHTKQSFLKKLREALKNTKTEWYHIPVGVGIGVVAFTQLRRRSRDGPENEPLNITDRGHRVEQERGEKEVRPMGSWQVQVLSTLPLKALSYYWGRFNEIPLPVFLRAPGFKLYSWIFGVNLDEVAEPLETYRNLAEFFYRQLKPGCRPIDSRPNSVVSPADGKVLQFGEVRAGGQVEQVKGMMYSLDALLGTQSPIISSQNSSNTSDKNRDDKVAEAGEKTDSIREQGDNLASRAAVYDDNHKEFANVNGISYTLPSLFSGSEDSPHEPLDSVDASLSPSSLTEVVKVGGDIAAKSSWWGEDDHSQRKRLFFAVVYLAPGDYHRFHSPVSWVVERRRHFAGELYSVSPYIQSRLPNLFTLNERVVLLGRWRYGMMSMTPVGATNVGSIKIHFDRELRTNSLTHDATIADKEGGPTFAEATYKGASALLGGHPIRKGGEMGGFNLGSTVVLVFEAPGDESGKGGFKFCVERGQYVKVGQALGTVEEM
ncbi:phosphatidylserine decarboxylase [Geopyxis carbonaria]|nr:phosphatidylserine decarboxylase [Geopyxis carbonaria]